MSEGKPTNDQIADVLEQIADLLEAKGANPFRVQAYRNGARTVRTTQDSISAFAQEGGEKALQELPSVGAGIASVINAYVHEGRSGMLERLKGDVDPEELFKQVPGIGEELAARIAEQLDVSSLEELEQASHDGRLEEVEGFGRQRVRNVQVSLAGMLSSASQSRRSWATGDDAPEEQPSVEALLSVDHEYRRQAKAGNLRKIAPKRFNPDDEAWLPILHTERHEWRFKALYSNTKRAHELDKTDDWVVLYYERDGEEDQATVVTETHGPLEGERVVRGREDECREYYGGPAHRT